MIPVISAYEHALWNDQLRSIEIRVLPENHVLKIPKEFIFWDHEEQNNWVAERTRYRHFSWKYLTIKDYEEP